MRPGIYPRMSFADYQRIKAVNNSTLGHFARSALHAKEAMTNPREPSAEMELGTAAHTAILEPNRFKLDFIAAPELDKRTRAGKDEWAAFNALNADKTVMVADEYNAVKLIAGSVWSCETAAALLNARGDNEVVVVWNDAETNLLCKGRMDAIRQYADWTFALDIKTTRDARKWKFSRSVAEYGYHRQAAMYLDGLTAIGGARQRRFAFIAVENVPPWAVAIYELDIAAIEQGQREYREHLARYKECVESGMWPGYGDGIQLLSLPKWAMKGDDDGF